MHVVSHKPKRFVAVADTHGDMIDPQTEEAIYAFCADFKPTVRIHMGDAFDFRCLRRKATDEERAEGLEADWEAGERLLRRFFEGGTENYYLRGNHSFALGTDLLTRTGWKPVETVTADDEVAEFDVASRAVFYSHPLALVRHPEQTVYSIGGRYSKQVVSSKHHVLLNGVQVDADQIADDTVFEDAVPCTGYAVETIAPMDADRLRLLTWVVMDGCIVNLAKYDPETTKARVQFKLSLPHKIERLRALLDRMGVKYTHALCKKSGVNKLQPYYIRIYGDEARRIVADLGGVKKLPSSWAKLPRTNLDAFLETLAETDGHAHYRQLVWNTIERHNVDVVQEWCVRNGVALHWDIVESHGFANGKPQYRACIGAIEHHRTKLEVKPLPYSGDVYCVTMPLGTVVSRFEGKVAFTGNCERLWIQEQSLSGLAREYAQAGIKRIGTLLRKAKVRKMLPYDSRLGVLKLGNLKMVHGYAAGVGAAAKMARAYGNVIFGHVHTIEVAAVDSDDGPKEARCIGACCQLDMPYNAHKLGKLRHANGFAYGYLFDNGDYQLFQTRKIDGHFYAATDIKTY